MDHKRSAAYMRRQQKFHEDLQLHGCATNVQLSQLKASKLDRESRDTELRRIATNIAKAESRKARYEEVFNTQMRLRNLEWVIRVSAPGVLETNTTIKVGPYKLRKITIPTVSSSDYAKMSQHDPRNKLFYENPPITQGQTVCANIPITRIYHRVYDTQLQEEVFENDVLELFADDDIL